MFNYTYNFVLFALLSSMQIGYCEDVIIKSKFYSDIIKFVEVMSGEKVQEPTLVKLDIKNLVGCKWVIPLPGGEKFTIKLGNAGAVEFEEKKSDLKWVKDGDVVIVNRPDEPVCIIVNTKEGYRAFSGDFMHWPILVKK